MSQSSTSSLKLRDAIVGSTLQVVGYEPAARAYKRKLLAMGLTPGTEFVVTRHAPLGDPTEIEVRGFHLSLRKDEADALRVEIAGSI
ncbi:ferrous iron transport protein A [Chroococcidiopsis sp. CCNUC1]|nr:ferrous iron transport protein A [Chroococcidiopsis sp. CCNUC1]